MTARDEILHQLRTALADAQLPFPPVDPPRLTDDERMAVTHAEGDPLALAERFGAELQKLHGTFQIVESLPEARMALIGQLLSWAEEEEAARKGAQLQTGQERKVLSWDPATLIVPALRDALVDLNFELVTPPDLRSDDARDAVRYIRYGVTGVAAAFATTGSMLMTTGPQTSRAASLLPFRHIALIPFHKLYPTLEAWLHEQRRAGTLVDLYREHANLTLISGPSKSADIEMNLTLGVHGPKFVHAILFGRRD
ncbi:MAG: LUD domain-containing protein [Caldilineaceae bacterium]|nr:LUD domain-containing protein [Caldilineaceae bacterium]